MTEWINNIDAAWFIAVFEALIYFIVGLILAKMASRAVRQWSKNRFDTHQQLLMARLIFDFVGIYCHGAECHRL